VLKQLLSFVQKYEIAALTTMRHSRQKFRFSNRWSRFSVLLIGQLAGRQSLRDITDNLVEQGKRLSHLGMKRTAMVALAQVNAEQPASLYQALFTRLLNRCCQTI
jgi:hypothetical protein